MAAQVFPLAELLTVYTGRLLCDMDGIYKLLDHIEGRPHWTHELPAAADRVTPALLEAHPWLGEIDTAELDVAVDAVSDAGPDAVKTACEQWVDKLAVRYGDSHPVGQLVTQ